MKYGIETMIIVISLLCIITNWIGGNINAVLGWGSVALSQLTIITIKSRHGES